MRGIDHLVLCANSLDAACARYHDMGFTLTPKALHPFGTANALVQLGDRSFLELLAVEDASAIPAPGPGQFSFARFNQRFIESGPGEGFSMLVLDSEDSQADHAAYTAAGLSPHEHFGFSRLAKLPTGEEVTVKFSMAFVTDDRMPDTAYFTCQQHHAPELFWKPEYQTHANTASGISEVILAGDDPLALNDFFGKLTGSSELSSSPDRVSVQSARGKVTVMSMAEWARHFPESYAPDMPSGPRLAAFVVSVENLDMAASCLREGNVPCLRSGHDLIVAPDNAFGTMVVFTAA